MSTTRRTIGSLGAAGILLILGAHGTTLALGRGEAMTPVTEAPSWAYPPCVVNKKDDPSSGPERLAVPGSSAHFTAADIADWSITKDWFPKEHGALPPILAASRSRDKAACGFCHLPDGSGRPENAKLAGLPAPYIVAQVHAFHRGSRAAAQSGWPPAQLMKNFTVNLSDAELDAAAEYFSQQTVHSFVKVAERDRVPAHAAACFVFTRTPGRAVSLGETILEMPVDARRFEARDPHTPYTAYVPPGSIERGRTLATTGDAGRTQVCAVCHGPGLKGNTSLPGPPLAGRFPGYLFRQLYGFQSGARRGDAALPMQAVVAQLTGREMIDLAAYAASLDP